MIPQKMLILEFWKHHVIPVWLKRMVEKSMSIHQMLKIINKKSAPNNRVVYLELLFLFNWFAEIRNLNLPHNKYHLDWSEKFVLLQISTSIQ